MTPQEIWVKLEKLPLSERLAISQALAQQMRAHAAHSAGPDVRITQTQLAIAAELMREEYATNPELTAFTAHDGEDFLFPAKS